MPVDNNNLRAIKPKAHQNYVAFFLTLSCNLRCPYCINRHQEIKGKRQDRDGQLSADDWITAANRLVLREDLPLTLQGGEPTLHKGFYKFVNEVRVEIKMDLLTNMTFDVGRFIKEVPVSRFTRKAPYAAIRVSSHPGQNDLGELIKKTKRLEDAGFRIGLYSVLVPDEALKSHILKAQEKCLGLGLDFRTKEFLGEYNGKMHGSFKYARSVGAPALGSCKCRTTEIIVDPAGRVYKCHADLYRARNSIAHILDADFSEDAASTFRDCDFYGDCNPCDVKIKTNRMQIFGHTSVEIKDIAEPSRL